ncbi:MAG: hypothetical protein VX527_11620 [Planctomycetota bacterium]|nr:hypothetical protein [Planctomycetota bacterium]
MSSFESPQTNIVAVIHRQGSRWACVAGQPLDADRIRVVDSQLLESDADLQPWINHVGAGSVRVIVPSSEVICRTCNLPDGEPDVLDEALRLQAETQLLGTAPPHRLAVAVLPTSGSDAVRTGLILAWPESSPWTAPHLDVTPLYTPDVTAVASLLGETRPANPIIWIDADNASLTIALAHMQGVQVRALREDIPPTDLRAVIGSAVAETALQADLPMDRIEAMKESISADLDHAPQQLLLPDAVKESTFRRTESETPLDEAWLHRYGIALGALLATSDDLVPLTMFQRELPMLQPTLVEATTEQLSSLRIAVWLMVAAVVLLVFAPLTISGIRLGMLRVSHPSLDYLVQQSERQDRQYAMYRALQSEAWPMTKLLADISNSTPEGIKLDTIRLAHGEPLKITGTATPPVGSDAARLVTEMKNHLESMGVFDDVVLRWDDMDTYGPRTFSVDARVARPLYRPRYEEERDFGTLTLAQRLYGVDAVAAAESTNMSTPASSTQSTPSNPIVSIPNTSTPASTLGTTPSNTVPPNTVAQGTNGDDSDMAARRPGSGRRPTGRTSGDGATRADSDSRGGNSGASMTGSIPQMLTQEQVDAMTKPEIRQQLVDVSQARKYARNNEELQKQLTEQFNLLMDGLKAKSEP